MEDGLLLNKQQLDSPKELPQIRTTEDAWCTVQRQILSPVFKSRDFRLYYKEGERAEAK